MNNYRLVKNTGWKEVEVNGEKQDIPSDWDINNLNTLCDVRDGTHDSPKFKEKGIPFITTKNLVNGKIDFSSAKFISEEDHNNFIKRSKVDNGDILTGMIGTVGNPIMVQNKTIDFSIKNVGLIKTKNKINQQFLFFVFSKTLEQEKTKSDGGVLKFMTLGELRRIELFYPSLSQQSAIADILSAQEAIVSDIESLIAKYESRFQYLSEELLYGRLRVKEVDGQTVIYKNAEDNWKEVEINGEMKSIPMDWEVETIGKTIPLNMGNTPKKEADNYNGDLPWITISNLTEKYIRNYTAKINKNKNIRLFPKGTLLISFKMSVGKCGFTTEDSAINEAIMGIQQKDTNDNLKYLYYSLPTIFSNNAMPNGQGLLLLNQEKIKSLNYVQPSFAEQLLLAKTLEKQEKLVEAQKEFLNKEKQKFDWLLDNLLSGQYLIKEV